VKKTQSERESRRSRRTFLRGVSAAAAGFAARAAAPEERSQPFTRDTLKCAEAIAGLSFTDAEDELILPNANRFRTYYEALREVRIAADVEPAFTFRPPIPATRPPGHATPNARITLARPLESSVPSSVEELAFLPVTALASLVERRRVSSTELTKMYIERLKRYDGLLQCVVTLTEDLALAQAAAADREIRAGMYRGPLHGIPWGVKDLFATKGIRTTWGATPYENQTINVDATAIERLREAGAVLVAKLSTGELAGNDVWFGGKTKNPWSPQRGSGGSSAGPASATAAGLVGFSVGTDTGGSIIQPASLCGAVGFRPTYGRISRHGVMPLRWTMDKVGPICRGVEDCALVFNALYGPDGRDETVADLPFAWNRDMPLSALRIGFVQREFEEPRPDADEESRKTWSQRKKALGEALEALRGAGARLDPISLPDLPAAAAWWILAAESGAAFDELVRSGAVRQLAGTRPNERANQLRASRFIPAVEYIQAQRVRTLLIREMEALLAKYDAFITPPDSQSVLMTSQTGHPAIVLKAGFVDDLPQGILITGRLYDEATLLGTALAYERATKWHTMHPNLEPLKPAAPPAGRVPAGY
jgi:Asp-tRNA(Asn)/Glu-tRNA(Gln) amidotransferase A subunit family amidase